MNIGKYEFLGPAARSLRAPATFLRLLFRWIMWGIIGVFSLLFILGVYIVIRFVMGRAPRRKPGTPGNRLMIPLGLVGGFVDATGGGGWGPVTTPTLLADGRLTPARVVGTVNTAEFIVALAASLGFLLGLGTAGIDLGIVLALLIGGVIAAPFAAWLVRFLNPRILGVVVGCFILLLNARLILMAVNADPVVWWAVYAVLVLASAAAITFVVRTVRRERKVPAEGTESVHA